MEYFFERLNWFHLIIITPQTTATTSVINLYCNDILSFL